MMIRKTVLSSYKAYGRVLCLQNDTIEAYVTLDVGPRIIRFGFIGGGNVMCDAREALKPSADREYERVFGEGAAFENLGGHRIWTSPEVYPYTYYPDTAPVTYELTECGAVFTPLPEKETGIAKQLELHMDETQAALEVVMRVRNISSVPKELAVWGLTVCAQGGVLEIPMNTRDTGLLHNRSLMMWPYTDMSDARLSFTKTHIYVRQDESAAHPFKIGVNLGEGAVRYTLGDTVFQKRYATRHPDGVYPDGGCSFETYTNDQFIEIESLGELQTVKAGQTVQLTEYWTLET